MAYRPSWQGHPEALARHLPGGALHRDELRRGCPLQPDQSQDQQPHQDDHHRSGHGPIERSELVKGYEVSKGEYILLTDEEIKSVKLESTKTIDIERFVPEGEIDRLYWDNPYFLAPDGKLAQEAFGVIRTAMEKSGQIALGRIVMSTRERILALEPRDKGILAYTIRTDAEVRKPDEIFGGISDKAADPQMIAIAEKIIEQQEGPFDPSQFVDRYEEALKALIEDKKKGHAPAKVAEPDDTNVIDLMSALRASLAGKDKTPAKPAAKSKASKAEATKPSTRKAS